MNRLRKYAVWAHQELLEGIRCRAEAVGTPDADVEAAARFIFNRICARRLLDVNGLGGGVGLSAFVEEKRADADVAFAALCDGLHAHLPDVFPPTDEASERLVPDDLFEPGGVVDHLIRVIPASSFDLADGSGGGVVGWLYQYFISETREEIIDPLYKKYITKKDIPIATQVFTPEWIVQYIVDNSLGRYWIERHADSALAGKLKYYISDEDGRTWAAHALRHEKVMTVDESGRDCRQINVIDPCVGAGHFLIYAIDVFIHIYRECGYSDREAIREIIRHNLYGLDIDDAVVQLARFAVMMKGCQYDPDFLSQGILPQIYTIRDLGDADDARIRELCGRHKACRDKLDVMLRAMKNGSALGSIVQVPDVLDGTAFGSVLNPIEAGAGDRLNVLRLLASQYDIVVTNPPYLNKYDDILKSYIQKHYKEFAGDLFSVFVCRCLQFCSPGGYVGMMTPNVWMFIKSYEKMRRYILTHHSITTLVQLAKGSFFNDATVDVCAFVMQGLTTGKSGVYFRLEEFPANMKTQRQKLAEGIRSASCAYRHAVSSDWFRSLPGMQVGYWISERVMRAFRIGRPLSETASPRQGLATTDNGKYLRHWFEVNFGDIGFGLDRETAVHSDIRWFPYNKGGLFRKWYGNQDYIVNYRHDGEEIKRDVMTKYPYLKTPGYVVKNPDTYFSPCLSWSKISSGSVAFRYFPQGFLYDVSGCSIFFKNHADLCLYAGFLNSVVCKKILEIISPTLNYEAGHIAALPTLNFDNARERIQRIVQENVALSHEDWDCFETSWGFKCHPLVNRSGHSVLIADLYKAWECACERRFNRLKANEEELNRIFIELYGLGGELTPEVEDRNVTVRRADLERDIRSLISYAVGCMFGRYSPDRDGVCFAGGDFDDAFVTVPAGGAGRDGCGGRCYPRDLADGMGADRLWKEHFGAGIDEIIPVTDEAYLAEDIVSRFVEFVRMVYGADTLEANLRFIADALGGRGSARDIVRAYFYHDFYADHVRIYQKRPIYWLFSSGEKTGFRCLVYMHRYRADTPEHIRTDYIHAILARFREIVAESESRLKQVSEIESLILKKQLKKLKEQIRELHAYEEKMRQVADRGICIDPDDGVKVNYAKFGDVLQAIW